MTAVNFVDTTKSDSMDARRIVFDTVAVDLASRDETLGLVASTLDDADAPALAVASANLDHFHHFGADGRSRGNALGDTAELRWKILLDGAPIAAVVRWRTGRSWPLLTGSDLLPDILEAAAAGGHTVGFLGGTAAMHEQLRATLAEALPDLKVAGTWAPSRAELNDEAQAEKITAEIKGAAPEILVVGLGKPRQEEWIQAHGAHSGARVLLAFGAATDFLAGVSTRAPRWVRHLRIEWLYRFVREPRRLFRRYLIEGPRAALKLIGCKPQSSPVLDSGPSARQAPSSTDERMAA